MQRDWTTQGPEGVSFTDENALFESLKALAHKAGLQIVPRNELDVETSAESDLVLARDGQRLLFAKRKKLDNDRARVDVDARPKPRHVLLEKKNGATWRALTDSQIPIESWALNVEGLRKFADLMLEP